MHSNFRRYFGSELKQLFKQCSLEDGLINHTTVNTFFIQL